jgi:hypothetical protein
VLDERLVAGVDVVFHDRFAEAIGETRGVELLLQRAMAFVIDPGQ